VSGVDQVDQGNVDQGNVEQCQVRASVAVGPADHLFVPHRKRMQHAYMVTEEGVRELHIYYGHKEVTFDEEHLFPFGERLTKESTFTAESATNWGPGYQWSEIRPLLEALIDEGILKRGDAGDDPRGSGLVASLVPASSCPAPRMWSAAECEGIARDLSGRAIEVGNLEAILPSYRIAHPALDGDGRQVGEANVFPPALRLHHEAEWRVCQYPGSRYQNERPMNVTALKAMIKHWKAMMSLMQVIRAEVLRRIPRSAAGWTTGDIHTFARVVLALPAYSLMKQGGASLQVPVHPVLSSLFRITDGIQMTTHSMLFLSDERTRSPEEPITAADLYGFAEHNAMFFSDFGVCAGPKAMIDEFFAIVFDGASPGTPGSSAEAFEHAPEVRALLSELPAAVDYALLGLQVWGVSRSTWTLMSALDRDLREIFAGVLGEPEAGAGAGARLRSRLDKDWKELERERMAVDREREIHHIVYADAYEQAWKALRTPLGAPTLAERIAPVPEGPMHHAAAAQLQSLLTRRLLGTAPAAATDSMIATSMAASIDRIVTLVMQFVRQGQAILASVTELQGAINALLERERPTRPLALRDFTVLFRMHPPPISAFPYIFDTLQQELSIDIEATATTLEIADRIAA
jgi:hypothetical protein